MDIQNLYGLDVLTKIHVLIIDSTLIVNLDGLNNITELNDIAIHNNPVLENISAIGQVHKIFFRFGLVNNDAMVDLAGLNFDTLGYCYIEYNDALITLHGLENLKYVKYRLRIASNPSLRDLAGLQNLTVAENELAIYNNDRIKNLEGLENLLWVGYDFRISNNDSLQSLAGLQHVQIGDHSNELFIISGNPQLDSCHIEAMCDYLDSGYMVYFSYNAQGCNSQDEVKDLCSLVNIEDTKIESDIQFYPNPTDGSLFVNYGNSGNPDQLLIYNHIGMEVLRLERPAGSIDITQLPPGVYIVSLSMKSFIKVACVVKL